MIPFNEEKRMRLKLPYALQIGEACLKRFNSMEQRKNDAKSLFTNISYMI